MPNQNEAILLRMNAGDSTIEFARCFLRLANPPNFALDRLNGYEAMLWRQIGQILFALDALDRRTAGAKTPSCLQAASWAAFVKVGLNNADLLRCGLVSYLLRGFSSPSLKSMVEAADLCVT
jgi:hypothetical protein